MKKFFLIGLVFALFVASSFALNLSIGGGFTGAFGMGWLDTTAKSDATPESSANFGDNVTVTGVDVDKRFGIKANIAIDYAELSLGYSHLTREQTINIVTKPATGPNAGATVTYKVPDEFIIAALFTAELIGKYPFGQEADPVRVEPFLGVGLDYAFWGKASSTKLAVERDPAPPEDAGSPSGADIYLHSHDLQVGGTPDALYDNNNLIYSRIRGIVGVGVILKLTDNINLNPRLACDYALFNLAGKDAKLGSEINYVQFNHWDEINFTARMDLLLDFKLISF